MIIFRQKEYEIVTSSSNEWQEIRRWSSKRENTRSWRSLRYPRILISTHGASAFLKPFPHSPDLLAVSIGSSCQARYFWSVLPSQIGHRNDKSICLSIYIDEYVSVSTMIVWCIYVFIHVSVIDDVVYLSMFLFIHLSIYRCICYQMMCITWIMWCKYHSCDARLRWYGIRLLFF